ncbi:lactate permease [Moorella sp. E308F]|jgi:lactate permease|uniref:L-lactate permease n=1 Tax=unclassified Neomoorella TaxID=2676739 RepID=UPI0010FFBC1E|nr:MULTISPECIES: lactate permease LctP family transporter [unclassified Moorella (in: firmicutes)]MDK2894978.1 lactate permease [Moorella sp. (in: firmicutes)]GEA14234.1 lactate permease [Moorella sp. E308F]GEA18381.1 lactate permease [Moorella sp. E306M]
MPWTQVYDPANNLAVSALLAAIPIIFLFYALAVRKMKGHIAAFLTVVAAIAVAVFGYRMPADLAILSFVNGGLYGLFPIGWIVVAAVFLYQITVKTGQFEIIKDSIAGITEDRRLQALLIAFSFGAFLEGSAGFGAPVAITAAMLAGLGFNPVYAASICLLANTAPVAFGAIGVPVLTLGQVAGIDSMLLSKMIGRQLPFLSVLLPFWLVAIMSGWKGVKETWPACLVSGGSFAVSQWFSSNYLSPMLPDIISALFSLICLILFLRVWQPGHIWRFPNETASKGPRSHHAPGTILKAWTPFIILTLMVADWGIGPVKAVLDLVTIKFAIPGLHQAIIKVGTSEPMNAIFTFNWLAAPGTGILIAAFISMLILDMRFSDWLRLFGETLHDLRYAVLTIFLVLGFAYTANYSGMSTTLGQALTVTGKAFPFVAPFLGWLGVFITGSDTSANALFGKLQYITAQNIGVDPVLTVAANSSGGVTGKMISPQSIAVATAATGQVGQEGELFRFAIVPSILMTVFISVITTLQAYFFTWMIPAHGDLAQPVVNTAMVSLSDGLWILAGTLIVIAILAVIVTASNRRAGRREVYTPGK